MRPVLFTWALCTVLIAGAHAQEASDEAVERNNRGASLLQQGKLDEAIAQFRQAIEVSRKYVTAHANLA